MLHPGCSSDVRSCDPDRLLFSILFGDRHHTPEQERRFLNINLVYILISNRAEIYLSIHDMDIMYHFSIVCTWAAWIAVYKRGLRLFLPLLHTVPRTALSFAVFLVTRPRVLATAQLAWSRFDRHRGRWFGFSGVAPLS